MKALLVSLLVLSSVSAFADSLRLEQDLRLERSGSTLLNFSVKAPGALAGLCNLHAYVSSTGPEASMVLKQGSEFKVVMVKSNNTFRNSDGDGKKYEVSTVTAAVNSNNSYLVADCRSVKGLAKVPSASEVLKIFSSYVSLTR